MPLKLITKLFLSVAHLRSTVQRTSKFRVLLDLVHLWRRLVHIIFMCILIFFRMTILIRQLVSTLLQNISWITIILWLMLITESLAERTCCCQYSHWTREHYSLEDVWSRQKYLLHCFLWCFIQWKVRFFGRYKSNVIHTVPCKVCKCYITWLLSQKVVW